MAGHGGARPGGGKKRGQFNRETLERELVVARQQLAQYQDRQSKGHKLAIDVLNDVMHVAYGMMAKHQPQAPGETIAGTGREPNPAEFKEWLKITREAAGELAPFQSAKFKSVTHHVESPIGGAVPENHEPVQAVSAQEAYRLLRDRDIIDLTPTGPVVDKVPAVKKQAGGRS